jgi:hypothetical protein
MLFVCFTFRPKSVNASHLPHAFCTYNQPDFPWSDNRKLFQTISVINLLTILTYLLTYSMEQSLSWEANWSAVSFSRNSPHSMEPEGSSPHSQAHATCPYPELATSNPHTHFPKIHPNIFFFIIVACPITGINTTCLNVIYTDTVFRDIYIDYYTLYSSLNLLGKVD